MIERDTKGNELIFYNYKEPLKKIERGYGYYGVILANKEGTGIQCHICGQLFGSLNAHVRQFHKIPVRKYKEKYQLAFTTSLVSEEERMKRKMLTINWLNSMSPEEKKRISEIQRKNWLKWKKSARTRVQPKNTLETKNKRGTCPDQLLAKISEVAKAIGHSPTKNEFIDYWKSQKYVHIIYKTFGSWDKAKQMAGQQVLTSGSVKQQRSWKKYTREELIEYMQVFYQENGRPPTTTDCRRGLVPDGAIYKRVFGSMQNARDEAGIKEQVGRWVNINK